MSVECFGFVAKGIVEYNVAGLLEGISGFLCF